MSPFEGRTAGETGFLIPAGVVGDEFIVKTPCGRKSALKLCDFANSRSVSSTFRRHGSSCLNGRLILPCSCSAKQEHGESATYTKKCRLFSRQSAYRPFKLRLN